jgi:hypothetical protein
MKLQCTILVLTNLHWIKIDWDQAPFTIKVFIEKQNTVNVEIRKFKKITDLCILLQGWISIV